jgi:3-dehydroquinate dehydratase-2
MSKHILILNGPNLNLLGRREPEIYGRETFEDHFKKLQSNHPDISLDYYQTNHEGSIIDKLHEVGFTFDGIILNAGGYTHTSIAIADAIKSISSPVVEVHISNIYEREPFRHLSYIEPVCITSIVGEGLPGYDQAINFLKGG